MGVTLEYAIATVVALIPLCWRGSVQRFQHLVLKALKQLNFAHLTKAYFY